MAGRRIPTESARGACRCWLTCGEKLDSFGSEERRAAAQEALGKARDGEYIAEESGMSGDAAHGAGVLVVDLALDDAVAIGEVVDGGRNR